MKLTELNTVRNLLNEFEAAPDKRYGQNFLISEKVVTNIAEGCGANENDGILEIGPGIGVLTQKLCERYKKVVSVEIDNKMAAILGKTMADHDNFTLISNDILKTDLDSLLKEHFDGMRVTVCANLPYYITSPIIMFLLESEVPFDNVTVMVQKEVADRLTAKPGSADYGAITPAVNYYADVQRLFTVPAGCFYPAPKVDSAVVRFKLRKLTEYEPIDKALMFEVIKYAFLQRRKTLSNALSADKRLKKEDVEEAIKICGLDPLVRGETLSTADFRRLSDALYAKL
ncbi:MAG: 16S rRNA (adenine(1518)-N(6)/adenine(1519)-N(6))-dimethyltransferase RsmA [Clostridia bacterium]|nr:16S rRNA (adenine(1518)-N(6)/adenine(1519)-N(6))-dimethyltransferase RsmA [Clostridia bacterium]